MSRNVNRPKTLKPIRANVGLHVEYQRRLDKAVAEMVKSVTYWILAAYRSNTPELAQDASPAMELRQAMRRLSRRWTRKFDVLSQELADYFALAASERTDSALRAALRKGALRSNSRPRRPKMTPFRPLSAKMWASSSRWPSNT
jgi:hypothetical protein